MRQKNGNSRKINKGMPSAVLLSILIHAALFLLAGTLVVFTVVKKKEIEFEPPKAVERPKMKLKKPKVKVRKSSKPKPTTRIVTKVDRASMPDIQLPEMSGMGDGLGDMDIGFDLLDFSGPTMYGDRQSIGSDFEGTFYDFKRRRDGKDISGFDATSDTWRNLVYQFLKRGWDTSVFARYYRAPSKLYATSLVVPMSFSSLAPLAFGDEDACGGQWMVHYKGLLTCPASHTNGITFRFWGAADHFIAVRAGGKSVFGVVFDYTDGSRAHYRQRMFGSIYPPGARKYYMGNTQAMAGDWITLKPGESLPMEILIGDEGGRASFFLAIEEEGVEYERNRQGGPILPAFQTARFSHDKLDVIYPRLHEGEICLTNGPVFCDYDTKVASARDEGTSHIPPSTPVLRSFSEAGSHLPKPALRTWTLADGRTLEAEFVNIFAGKVVLKSSSGKIRKVPKERLSAEDIEYSELASSPDLDINFLKNFRKVDFSGGYYDLPGWGRPAEDRGHYGLQIKQTSPGEYSHELKVELFVIGKQWRRSKYILLDHQETVFILSDLERRFFEFRSPREVTIRLEEDTYFGLTFGEKYYGHLVAVTDERGKMVAMKSSHKWLPGIFENLQKLSVGNFMDETGVRTYPDHPKKSKLY
ncbi:MAG: SHD1 domain-containing protein [Verrucomicrobiota bacterium]